MITTIIFDLDGTLLNTLDDLWASVNYSLAQNGFPSRSKEEVRSFLGNGVKILIEKSLPKGYSNKDVHRVLSTFQPYYLSHAMDLTRPYDGVMEMLRDLKDKGYKTAIVSNKPDTAVQELYNSIFLNVVDVAIGECYDVRRKPFPDMVMKAIERLASKQDESIYVGDSEVDYATAKNSGIPCISVSWGFRDKDYLKSIGSEWIIDSPNEIMSMIDRI